MYCIFGEKDKVWGAENLLHLMFKGFGRWCSKKAKMCLINEHTLKESAVLRKEFPKIYEIKMVEGILFGAQIKQLFDNTTTVTQN